MPSAEKTAAVAELSEAFRSSSAALLTEYRGLTVAELTELRRSLGEGARYAIVKNTLTRLALRDNEVAEAELAKVDSLLQGPTAVAFITGDPVEAAKGIRDFARAHPLLVVKGGLLENRALSQAEVTRLADLESREVLLARLAGALQASLSRAAGLFQAPLSQVARLAAALRDKAEQDPSVLRAGAGTATPSAPAAGTAGHADSPAAGADRPAGDARRPAELAADLAGDADSSAGDPAGDRAPAGGATAGSPVVAGDPVAAAPGPYSGSGSTDDAAAAAATIAGAGPGVDAATSTGPVPQGNVPEGDLPAVAPHGGVAASESAVP